MAGALNGGDVALDLIVIPSIVMFGVNRSRLKPFEKYYLAGIILICLFWLFTADAFTSNLFVQVLLTVAYFRHIILSSNINAILSRSWSGA